MKILTIMSKVDFSVTRVWVMSDGVTLVRPHLDGDKPKGNFRILSNKEVNIWYDKTELGCEVYKSNIQIVDGRDDNEPPKEVELYQDFIDKSNEILEIMEARVNEELSKSLGVSKEPENPEESSDSRDSQQVGD